MNTNKTTTLLSILTLITLVGCNPSTGEKEAKVSASAATTEAAAQCRARAAALGVEINCGDTEATLLHGTDGAQGIQGAQGAQGNAGSNGTNGTNGANGAIGATGPIGPRGFQGPAGAGAGHEFWLVYLDGTPIAPIVTINAKTILVWDEGNNLPIHYKNRQMTNQIPQLMISEFYTYLNFTTDDCSGQPYLESTADNDFLPGTAFGIAGVIFKVEYTPALHQIKSRLLKSENVPGLGNFGACQVLDSPWETYYHHPLTEITTTLPMILDRGTYKIDRR